MFFLGPVSCIKSWAFTLRGMGVYWVLGGRGRCDGVACKAALWRVEALGGQPRRRVGGPGGSQATASQRLRADTFVAARFVGHAGSHKAHERGVRVPPSAGSHAGLVGIPEGCPGRREHSCGGRGSKPKAQNALLSVGQPL